METISKGHFTLKRIFEDNWEQFLSNHQSEVGFSAAYNVWKVMNRREPEGLGYAAYACPDHPDRIRILLFEKRSLMNAVFSASARTILSFGRG